MKDLAEIIDKVRDTGYRNAFAMRRGKIHFDGVAYGSDEVTLIDTVSCDMGTDPGDDATVYLLSLENGERGYIVLPDGPHVDPAVASFVDELRTAERRGSG